MFRIILKNSSYVIIWLALFHLLIIICSNYLVQLPISVLGFTTTWGTFSFPFTFLATDLTVRIFGTNLARKIILLVMIPALIMSYCISSLFYQGIWQGFVKLGNVNIFVIRIACASLIGYALSQILDIYLFNYLRRQNSRQWIAPLASVIFSNASDTLVFFFIAFYQSTNPFMAEHWVEMAMVDYNFKLLTSLILLLPMYNMLLNLLLKC